MHFQLHLIISFFVLCFSTHLLAEEFTINQTNKQFSETSINIKKGDSINFVNTDPFFHNVYSLSEIKQFDLGFYRKGIGKTIAFDKPGTAIIECAIHPNMKLTVKVSE